TCLDPTNCCLGSLQAYIIDDNQTHIVCEPPSFSESNFLTECRSSHIDSYNGYFNTRTQQCSVNSIGQSDFPPVAGAIIASFATAVIGMTIRSCCYRRRDSTVHQYNQLPTRPPL